MLRFENGARGSFWVTQAAAGVENCLRIRVSGTKGARMDAGISASTDFQTVERTFAKPHAERTWHIATI
jgi:predicted dehydrogenase